MLRLCSTWIQLAYGHGNSMSDHIVEFFTIYVDPPSSVTTMFDHRSEIRKNNFLNKLLHDNNNGLTSIYERFKNDKNLFTISSAHSIFTELTHENYQMTSDQITDQFVLSLMTVINETIPGVKLKKYENLYYVEFLEMICRIAIVGITMQDMLEYKVHLLLEIMYESQYKHKYMNP